MKEKVYRNFTTNEIVYKEDAQEYAQDKLGIKIEPKGKNGEFTQEQMEFSQSIADWYFSGNWIEDIIEEDEEQDYYAVMDDLRYEDSVNKELGVY